MEDTAVLDLVGTDEGLDSAPPLEPETAPLDALPETDEGNEESPETESADPLSKLTDDELKNDPRVAALLKSQEARLNESARRKSEAAANKARQESLEREHGEALNRIYGETGKRYLSGISRSVALALEPAVKKWADEMSGSDFKVDPRTIHAAVMPQVDAIAKGLVAGSMETSAQIFEAYRRREYPSYKADEEDVAAFNDAKREKDPRKLGAAAAAMLVKAHMSTAETDIRKDERQKVLAELKASAETKQQTEAAKARVAAPKPTPASPTGSVNGKPRVTIEEISAMGVNGFRSRFPDAAERKRVLEEARSYSDRLLAGAR